MGIISVNAKCNYFNEGLISNLKFTMQIAIFETPSISNKYFSPISFIQKTNKKSINEKEKVN